MSKAYDLFGPAVVNYWKEVLLSCQIDPDKINEMELTNWINDMELIVLEDLVETIPDEWFPEDDIDEDHDDDEEWEDIPDHDDDED